MTTREVIGVLAHDKSSLPYRCFTGVEQARHFNK